MELDSAGAYPLLEEEEETAPLRPLRWPAALTTFAALGWTGFTLWAEWPAFVAGITPREGAALTSQWAMPLALIGVCWLLVMRNSRREAIRFAQTGRALSDESARLETRLTAVNRELSLAREFIAAQSRDLESLGRIAGERIGEHASRLQSLIHENGAQVEAISGVSATALDNMEKLRGQLPVIASSAKDVANNIGAAGHTAQTHLDELVDGFVRLGNHGETSERRITGLHDRIDTMLTGFATRLEQLREQSEAYLAALTQSGENLKSRLAEDEAAGLAAIRTRAAMLGQELEHARRALDTHENDSLTALHGRIGLIGSEAARLDDDLARRRAAQEAQGERLSEQSEQIVARFEALTNRMNAVAAFGTQARDTLEAGLSTLAERLLASREALSGTDRAIAGLTDGSVRLLELLQASSQQSREVLPQALAVGENHLAELEQRIHGLHETVTAASARGSDLAQTTAATRAALNQSLEDLARLHGGLSQQSGHHAATLEDLHGRLSALGRDSEALSARMNEELSAALSRLGAAARDAVATLEGGSRYGISAIAERLGAESGAAVEQALRQSSQVALGGLEQAVARATQASGSAATQLREELARVEEIAGHLEGRVAHARQQAETRNGDFAHRAAMIGEALNSNAIDITKALSSEITDTAWTAYLRGDRGIFTRRAVRLLDSGEARSIAALYGEDAEFREHVARYVHDFEAMLREFLTTSDGQTLGVTLVSSDMGKLYVALAQAIERLRN